MPVLFICCAVQVNKSGLSLLQKIRHVYSNMSLFLKKSYNQRGHLWYVNIRSHMLTIYDIRVPTTTLNLAITFDRKS
jgi:hypothetical protein